MVEEIIKKNCVVNINDYCFSFTKDECYKVWHGKCPVEANKENLLNKISYDIQWKCEKIMKSIIERGYIDDRMPVIVCKSACGKYIPENGRHRLCASSKLGVKITIHYFIQDEVECNYCKYNFRANNVTVCE